MPFLQLIIELGDADPAPYEDALFALGALAVTLQDAADDPILEPAPGSAPLWPTVRIDALFAASTDHSIVHRLATQLDHALPPYQLTWLADRPWEREWLKDFHAMRFGQRLWVCPAGQYPTDPDAIIVDLDPGLAFGTGTHATTALCLEWLDAHAQAPHTLVGRSIIDYGCGSGILAIAALKLGAHRALGLDIDPQALQASRDNAIRNQVSASLTVTTETADLSPSDIVLANILAQPLHDLAPTLAHLVVPGGHIVLSGLLTAQAHALQQRYATWFNMGPIIERDGWSLLSGCRFPG